jgi:hypothetical protein
MLSKIVQIPLFLTGRKYATLPFVRFQVKQKHRSIPTQIARCAALPDSDRPQGTGSSRATAAFHSFSLRLCHPRALRADVSQLALMDEALKPVFGHGKLCSRTFHHLQCA